MTLEKLQQKKSVLINLVKSAENATFSAKQQDCYGMADKIDACRRYELFLVEWLGEIQTQIDDINKGEVSKPTDWTALKEASKIEEFGR